MKTTIYARYSTDQQREALTNILCLFFYVFSFMSITGCAITKDELRLKSDNSSTAVINAPYEDVYTRLTDRASECFQRGFPGASSIVQHQITPRSQTANVSVVTLASGMSRVWLTIDIRALTNDKAEITAYTARNSERFQIIRSKVIKDWAEGRSKECP